jgi:hypothetical protein
MCVQGFFDPFCAGLAQAPGGEGCYRCANGGNCTAPDVCDCAPGWGGFDCRTPTCSVVATALTRINLNTVDEEKVSTSNNSSNSSSNSLNSNTGSDSDSINSSSSLVCAQ